jgi:hypothetical protein
MKKRVTWAEPAPAAHAPSRHWLVHILINVQLIVLLEIGILLLTGQGQRFIEWLRPGTVGTGNSGISAGTGETTAAPAAAALGAAGDPYPVTQAAVLGGLLALVALAGLVPRLVGWRRAAVIDEALAFFAPVFMVGVAALALYIGGARVAGDYTLGAGALLFAALAAIRAGSREGRDLVKEADALAKQRLEELDARARGAVDHARATAAEAPGVMANGALDSLSNTMRDGIDRVGKAAGVLLGGAVPDEPKPQRQPGPNAGKGGW